MTMENLEPKTRFEYFLNKIANSGQPLVVEVQHEPDNSGYELSLSTEEIINAFYNGGCIVHTPSEIATELNDLYNYTFPTLMNVSTIDINDTSYLFSVINNRQFLARNTSEHPRLLIPSN